MQAFLGCDRSVSPIRQAVNGLANRIPSSHSAWHRLLSLKLAAEGDYVPGTYFGRLLAFT